MRWPPAAGWRARVGKSRTRSFTPDTARLITTGGFDTHLDRLAGCDWIVEAVVERLDIKQALLAKVEPLRADGAIVSSNTSGIPIASIADGRGEAFRRHWLGTHFFNPPRYLSLLEVIPTGDTDPAVVETIARFGDHVLGKGVVVARDTPNFIGNRIGLYGVMRVFEQIGNYTIEEMDAITGPAIGRPKSADVPDDGCGRARHPGPCRRQPGRTTDRRGGARGVRAAAGRRRHGGAGLDRREGWPRLLQEATQGGGRCDRHP